MKQWNLDMLYRQTGEMFNRGSPDSALGVQPQPHEGIAVQPQLPEGIAVQPQPHVFQPQPQESLKRSQPHDGVVVHLLLKHGKIFFLECGSDFVQLLVDLLRNPVGAVISVVDTGPLANLSESMADLCEATRSCSNGYALPRPINMNAMLKEVSASTHCSHLPELTPVTDTAMESTGEECIGCSQPVCSNVTISGKGPWTLTSHVSNFSAMVVFTGIDGDVLNMTVKFPIAPDIMIGFAPKELVLSQLGTPALFLRCGFYVYCENARLTLYGQDGTVHKPSGVSVPSIAFRLRFIGGKHPSMRCAADYGEFTPLAFETQIPGNLQYCPVVTFGKANQTCIIAEFATTGGTEVGPVVKERMASPVQKFLISNDLEICESSSANAIQLMQKFKIRRTDLEVSSVIASPQHINTILCRAFQGQGDTLHYAFSDGRASHNLVSADTRERSPSPDPSKSAWPPMDDEKDAHSHTGEEKTVPKAKAHTLDGSKKPPMKEQTPIQVEATRTSKEQIPIQVEAKTASKVENSKKSAGGQQKPMSRDDVLKLVDSLLINQTAMDKMTAKCWKDFAEFDDVEGRPCLDLDHAKRMNISLTREFGLPEAFFSDLDELFKRFDFNGNGMLDKRECVKMYRFATIQKRRLIGGRSENIDIPAASLEEKGYTMVRKLGEGGQGSMHLAKREGSKKKYCIKVYDKSCDEDTGGIDAIIDEFQLMEELEHINVCRTYEMFQSDSNYYLVNEPYFGGDLTKLYEKITEKRVEVNETWWRNVFRQILSGLEYLHSQAIVHCDLKEPNVMIALDDNFKDPRPVLIDLGLAQFFADSQDSGGCGTPGYIPPEVYDRGFWSPRGDIFSLGVVFFQLLANRIPGVPNDSVVGILQVADWDDDVAMAALAKSPLPWDAFPSNVPELRNLLEWMTCPDESQRPRVPQCSEHDWFHCGSNAAWKPQEGKTVNSVLAWFK